MRKRMNNIAVIVLGIALTGAILTGCGESRQSGQDTQQSMPTSISEETGQNSAAETAEADETEETAPASKEYEDNFAVDSEAAKEFAGKVKDATAQKDMEALVDLTAFPVYVGLPDVGVVETKEDFLKLGAENVFTDELTESVKMLILKIYNPVWRDFLFQTEG